MEVLKTSAPEKWKYSEEDKTLGRTLNYGNFMNNRDFSASGDQALPVENSIFLRGRLNITKKVEELVMNKSRWTLPEFLITWVSGDEKRIKYVYSGLRGSKN